MKSSEIIKNIRRRLSLSQSELAEKLGVSFATVNRWEKEVPQLAGTPDLTIPLKICPVPLPYFISPLMCRLRLCSSFFSFRSRFLRNTSRYSVVS